MTSTTCLRILKPNVYSTLKRASFSALFILAFFSCAHGQSDILYDLDNYKQVIFQQKTLLLTPNGNVQFNDQVNTPGREADLDINFIGNLARTNIKNEENQQYTSSQSVSLSVGQFNSLRFTLSADKRLYKNNNYIRTGYEIESANSLREVTFPSQNSVELQNDVEGVLGFGRGRIEYVNHAWSAVMLFQALEDNNQLRKVPSEDEISEFANLIGIMRRMRILDPRLRDIDILETIVEFLKKEQFIDEAATMPILIVQDSYNYDERIQRFTGNRFEISLTPKIKTLYSKNTAQGFTHFNSYEAIGDINYLTYQNYDVHWMRTFSYGSDLKLKRFKSNEENNRTPYARGRLYAMYIHDYSPNLRNNFRCSINSSIRITANFVEDETEISAANFSTQASLNYAHYFSPSTQFNSTLALIYNDDEFQSGYFQPTISSFFTFSLLHNIY